MGTRRVNVRLPDDLVEKADVVAEATHKDRTEVLTEALVEHLGELEDDEAVREAVVELYLDGDVGFEALVSFVGRRDAEAIRASRRLLDRADELAEELAEL